MRAVAARLGSFVLPVLIGLAGCGYSMGVDTFDAGVRTVAVSVADNRSFRQRLELPLTRELFGELARQTDLRPASFERADAILKVTISDVEGRNLVRGRDTPVREGALDYVVDVELVDRATGSVLAKEQVLDRAEYRIPVGETLDTAVAEASRDLARKIVLALEGAF